MVSLWCHHACCRYSYSQSTSHPWLASARYPPLPIELRSASLNNYTARWMSPAASGLWPGGGIPARGCCCCLGAGSATDGKPIQGGPVRFGEMPAPLGPNPIVVCISWSIRSKSVRRRGKSALARCRQPSPSMLLPSESQHDNPAPAPATAALPSVLGTGRSSPSVQCCC
jgi:hypothetical protein